MEEVVENVRQSYKRCLEKGDFFEVFYDTFLSESDSIAAKFENTNWHQQRQLIQHAVKLAILYAEEPNVPIVEQHMANIGRTHSRENMDIHPEWYPLWLGSMVAAVKKCDPEFSEVLGSEWRKVLTPAINLITSKYNSEE